MKLERSGNSTRRQDGKIERLARSATTVIGSASSGAWSHDHITPKRQLTQKTKQSCKSRHGSSSRKKNKGKEIGERKEGERPKRGGGVANRDQRDESYRTKRNIIREAI